MKLKNSLIVLLVVLLVGCSTAGKQKLKHTLQIINETVEDLNDKYCAEKNDKLREILIDRIQVYVPFYPEEGYCLLVEEEEQSVK